MKLLGAVLAGGTSSRFGSDKALAVASGRRLIDGVLSDLTPQVAQVVVCGREWPGLTVLADHPVAGLGPLGGLCAALRFAGSNGFDAVLTAPCDLLGLPPGLTAMLAPGPSVAAGQRTVGLWPSALAVELAAYLATKPDDRSLRGWAAACGARSVDCGPITGVNHPADLPVV